MKDLISNFTTAFQAERIKIKRTGIFIISVILGFIIPAVTFLSDLLSKFNPSDTVLPFNHYLDFLKTNLDVFTYFFFPLLIIILVSRICQLDHRNGGWKLMETQPLRKISIYFSKFSIVLFSMLIAIVSILLFSVFFAWLLSKFDKISAAAILTIQVLDIIQIMVRLFFAGLSVAALQYLISVLISSFIWSVVIGFGGIVFTLAAALSQWVLSWNPFEILINVSKYFDGSDLGHYLIFTEWISLFYTIILLFVGFQWYKHRKFKLAFLSKGLRLLRFLVIVGILGILVFFQLKPNQMGLHQSTVICGEIESGVTFENVIMVDQVIGDTLAMIPVQDGVFHHVFPEGLLLDTYEIYFDNKIKSPLFMGNQDSVHVKVRFLNKQEEYVFTGTRLVENQLKANERDYSPFSYWLSSARYLENPEIFIDAFYSRWKSQNKEKVNYKTVDNYIPKADFFERDQMLLAVKYLSAWETYVEKRKALYPDEETLANEKIQEVQSLVRDDEESLLSSQDYFLYASNQIIKNDDEDIDANIKSLRAIAKLETGSYKDKLLFLQINKSLTEASTSLDRQEIVGKYLNEISNDYYKDLIRWNYKIIDNLSKGKIAENFTAVNLKDEIVSLADFKGSYVLIDVWATWCGPCRVQSPHFERHALKYKNENIQFIALSVDARKEDWYIDAQSKSKSVLQLHLIDKDIINNQYNVKFIPRFIMIDPEGRFVYSEMAFPADKAFEVLLRNELGLPEEI